MDRKPLSSNQSMIASSLRTRRISEHSIAGLLFGLLGLVWIGFGLVSYKSLINGTIDQSAAAGIVAALMLGNAFMALWVGGGMLRSKSRNDRPGSRFYFVFGAALLLINIFLTITDEFGYFDLFTLIYDILLLFYLIIRRKAFLQLAMD